MHGCDAENFHYVRFVIFHLNTIHILLIKINNQYEEFYLQYIHNMCICASMLYCMCILSGFLGLLFTVCR